MRRVRRLLALVASVVALAFTVTPAHASGTISCYYRLLKFEKAFMADLFVTNQGAPITGWTAHWTFSSDERLGNVWGAIMVQREHDITATNVSWNASIPTGGTMSFGWTALASSTSVPTDITINGMPC